MLHGFDRSRLADLLLSSFGSMLYGFRRSRVGDLFFCRFGSVPDRGSRSGLPGLHMVKFGSDVRTAQEKQGKCARTDVGRCDRLVIHVKDLFRRTVPADQFFEPFRILLAGRLNNANRLLLRMNDQRVVAPRQRFD